jgi:hypothetical protein
VTDDETRWQSRSNAGQLAFGDGEQHDISGWNRLAASNEPVHFRTSLPERRRECGAESASANDGNALIEQGRTAGEG